MNGICSLREPEDYAGPLEMSFYQRLKAQLSQITSGGIDSVSFVLTLASLVVSSTEDDEVLVFSKDTASRLLLLPRDFGDSPPVVAYFARRTTAEQMISGDHLDVNSSNGIDIHIPPSPLLVSAIVEKDGSNDVERCTRYLLSLSSYRPASYVQHGLVVGEDEFTIVSVGLDNQRASSEIPWTHPFVIQKLCTFVKLVRDDAVRPRHPATPKLVDVITTKTRTIGLYSAKLRGCQFRLLPILSRAAGRKPFVALGVSEDDQDVRVFKYSWYRTVDCWQEHKLLHELQDAPGIVRLDDELSDASLETNAADSCGLDEDSRVCGLLVLRTIGYPLCACESVLEFLEAMYDLLEGKYDAHFSSSLYLNPSQVLRYLTQEKNILHRDVSWSNILIRPKEYRDLRRTGVVKESRRRSGTNDEHGTSHRYRFVSDIFEEDRWEVRVALADFDHASYVRTVSEDEPRARVGTPMFMAEDVLSTRNSSAMTPFSRISRKVLGQALNGCVDKYANNQEKREWDEFYEHFTELRWKIEPEEDNDNALLQSFRHGAVHDAESVVYLCLLFFNRLWPFDEYIERSEIGSLEENRGKLFEIFAGRRCGRPTVRFDLPDRTSIATGQRFEPAYNMLKAMLSYVSFPWYNVAETGRRERYEFHLHDFMQRLILKEIRRLRSSGDPIFIEENPLPITMPYTVPTYLRYAYSSSSFSRSSESVEEVRKKLKNGASCLYKGRGCSTVQEIFSARARHVQNDTENGMMNLTCGREKNGLSISSTPNTLVLPVDRPKEMPERDKEMFHDPTGTFWEIYWWKARERLWVTAER
ncbi:hypothetical protein ACEPAF_1557 [Sanghuangporus sanghuang]